MSILAAAQVSFPRAAAARRGIIWTLKNQLGQERHSGRVPPAVDRIVQRPPALNAIWPEWEIGAPVKWSLIAYVH